MPWEVILGGATGGVAVAIVLTVLFVKLVAEKIIDAAQKRFESALKRAEELHKSTLAMASTVDTISVGVESPRTPNCGRRRAPCLSGRAIASLPTKICAR